MSGRWRESPAWLVTKLIDGRSAGAPVHFHNVFYAGRAEEPVDKIVAEHKSVQILDKLPARRKTYPIVKGQKDFRQIELVCVAMALGFAVGFTVMHFSAIPDWIVFAGSVLLYLLYVRLRYWNHYKLHSIFKVGRFEDLLEIALKEIEKHPHRAAPYSWAGAAYLSLGKPDEAIEFCNHALSIQPNDVYPLINRAQSYAVTGNGEQALADASEVIRRRPKLGIAYFTRGLAHLALRQYEDAIEDWNKAIKLKTYVNRAYVNQVLAKVQLNRLNEALTQCERLFELLSSKPSAQDLAHTLYLKGVIMARRLRFEEAISEFTQALDLSPHLKPLILVGLAYSRGGLNRLNEALADLDTAEKEHPNPRIQALLHSNRARVYLRKGEIERALEEAERGTKAWPDLPPVISTYGMILTRAGQFEKAKTMLDQAITLDRYYSEAYWFRHELYEKLNEPEKAASDKQIAEGYEYKPDI
jgi:tetratricopeptide (TPR) repeat protein